MTTPDARGLALRARAMAKFRREVGSPMLTEMAAAIDALSAENERLRGLLELRDGGSHDGDCRIHTLPWRGCSCGHSGVVAALRNGEAG